MIHMVQMAGLLILQPETVAEPFPASIMAGFFIIITITARYMGQSKIPRCAVGYAHRPKRHTSS